ncbi:uncharacterized protein C20orf204 homolog [Leptosomus discolor]
MSALGFPRSAGEGSGPGGSEPARTRWQEQALVLLLPGSGVRAPEPGGGAGATWELEKCRLTESVPRSWGAPGNPVGAESLGTDLQKSLAHVCAKYLPAGTGESSILPRALSCAVLLLLLVAALGRGKRCSIAKILRQYRAVIFHEIQYLKNLSGSADRSAVARPACRSDKDQKILLSIYNISMSLREGAAGTLRGPEELAVRKVARNTDFVLRENCRKISKSPPRIPAQPQPGGSSRRRKQLREIVRKAERLATCWEKLYALHAPRRAPRGS